MKTQFSLIYFFLIFIPACSDQVSFRSGEPTIDKNGAEIRKNKGVSPRGLETLSLTQDLLTISSEKIDISGNIVSHESDLNLLSKLQPGSTEDYGSTSLITNQRYKRSGLGISLSSSGNREQSAAGAIFSYQLMKLQPGLVDILLVLDHTASTFSARQKLVSQFGAAIDQAYRVSPNAINWRLAVTTMSALQSECILTYIDATETNALSRLQSVLSMTTTTDDDERPFLMADRALAQNCNISGQAGSWKRIGVPLGVLYFSDEDSRGNGDLSLSSPDERLLLAPEKLLANLSRNRVTWSGMFIFRPSDSPGQCPEGVAKGNRYDSINLYHDLYSICQSNYTNDLLAFFQKIKALSEPQRFNRTINQIVSYTVDDGPALDGQNLMLINGKVDLTNDQIIPTGSIVKFKFTTVDRPILRSIGIRRTMSASDPLIPLPIVDYHLTVTERIVDEQSGEIVTTSSRAGIEGVDFQLNSDKTLVNLMPPLQKPLILLGFSWRERLEEVKASFPPLIKKDSFQDCQLGIKEGENWVFTPYTKPFDYNNLTGEIRFREVIPSVSAFKCRYLTVDDPVLIYEANLPEGLVSPLSVVDAQTFEAIDFNYNAANDHLQFPVPAVFQGRRVLLKYQTTRPQSGRIHLGRNFISASLQVQINDSQKCESEGPSPDLSIIAGELELGGRCLAFDKALIRYRRIADRKSSVKFEPNQMQLFLAKATELGCQTEWTVSIDGEVPASSDWKPSTDGLGVELLTDFAPQGSSFASPVLTLSRSCQDL